MEITKEMLEEREAQLQDDLSAVLGALQDVRYWLLVLAEEPPAEVSDAS